MMSRNIVIVLFLHTKSYTCLLVSCLFTKCRLFRITVIKHTCQVQKMFPLCSDPDLEMNHFHHVAPFEIFLGHLPVSYFQLNHSKQLLLCGELYKMVFAHQCIKIKICVFWECSHLGLKRRKIP